MARPVFVLRVQAEPGVDVIRSLRAWLKRGLRDYGLRCVRIQQVSEKENEMAINLNDADDQRPKVMPPGAYWVKARVRPGNSGPDGQLRLATNQYSLMLDLELTVLDDDEWRGKKIFDLITCDLQEYDHNDQSTPLPLTMDKLNKLQTSVRIGRSKMKAIINSAFNLMPDDKSDEAQARRTIEGYEDFNGLIFIVQVDVQPARDRFPERNVVNFIIEPGDPAYRPRGSNSKQLVTAPKPAPKTGGGAVPFDDEIPFAPYL
jgi:hypothetical protein